MSAGTSCSRLREQVLIALEGLRKSKQIGSAQEAKVRIATNRPEHWLPDRELLATLCIVSEVEIVADPAATAETVTAPRLRMPSASGAGIYRPTVGQDHEHPTLCERVCGVVDADRGNFGARARDPVPRSGRAIRATADAGDPCSSDLKSPERRS